MSINFDTVNQVEYVDLYYLISTYITSFDSDITSKLSQGKLKYHYNIIDKVMDRLIDMNLHVVHATNIHEITEKIKLLTRAQYLGFEVSILNNQLLILNILSVGEVGELTSKLESIMKSLNKFINSLTKKLK